MYDKNHDKSKEDDNAANSDSPDYENEVSIYELETTQKVEGFRVARNEWIRSNEDQEIFIKDKDQEETTYYNGRCWCLRKWRVPTNLLRNHYKTLRPGLYWTLKRKLPKYEIPLEKIETGIIRIRRRQKRHLERASGLLWSKEEVEECQRRASKLKNRRWQKEKKKECKEMVPTGPCKRAIKKLKAAKIRDGVIESCKCDPGGEVTVVIKGFCLCDKTTLDLNRVCDEYSKKYSVGTSAVPAFPESLGKGKAQEAAVNTDVLPPDDDVPINKGNKSFVHLSDSLTIHKKKVTAKKLSFDDIEVSNEKRPKIKSVKPSVKTKESKGKKRLTFENEALLKGDGAGGRREGSDVTIFRKLSKEESIDSIGSGKKLSINELPDENPEKEKREDLTNKASEIIPVKNLPEGNIETKDTDTPVGKNASQISNAEEKDSKKENKVNTYLEPTKKVLSPENESKEKLQSKTKDIMSDSDIPMGKRLSNIELVTAESKIGSLSKMNIESEIITRNTEKPQSESMNNLLLEESQAEEEEKLKKQKKEQETETELSHVNSVEVHKKRLVRKSEAQLKNKTEKPGAIKHEKNKKAVKVGEGSEKAKVTLKWSPTIIPEGKLKTPLATTKIVQVESTSMKNINVEYPKKEESESKKHIDKLNASSKQKLDDTSSKQKLDDTSSKQKLDGTSSKQKLDDTSSKQKLDDTSSKQKLDDTSSGQKPADTSTKQKRDDTSSRQELNDSLSGQELSNASIDISDNLPNEEPNDEGSKHELNDTSSIVTLYKNKPEDKSELGLTTEEMEKMRENIEERTRKYFQS